MLRNNNVISDLFPRKIIIKWRTYIEVSFGNNSIHIAIDILRRFQSVINHHGASQRNNAACDYWKDQNRDLSWINIFKTRIKISHLGSHKSHKNHLILTVIDFLPRQAFRMRRFWLFRNSFLVFRVHGQVYDPKEIDPKPSIHQYLGSKRIGLLVVLSVVTASQ